VLVGGSEPGTGNVFARNPVTCTYGPVCDDDFDILDVSFICFAFWCLSLVSFG